MNKSNSMIIGAPSALIREISDEDYLNKYAIRPYTGRVLEHVA
jgi:membrane associated rhomboid family serine protease